MRISEVRTLKVWDIDFDWLTIHLKWAKWQKDRITILPQKIAIDLKKYCEQKNWSDLLFESERWDMLHPRTLDNMFNHALTRSWISKLATFHSLRHSFATHLLENGTNIRYIQSLLWHANIRTTQIHIQITNPMLKKIQSTL